MQGFSVWLPPTGTLGGLVGEARQRADAMRHRAAELDRAAAAAPHARSFAAALRRDDVAVVAEVKRRSPSKGWIRPGLAATEQARAYERGGASAVSVLTEPTHFGGSVEDLQAVRGEITIPILKKDFHIAAVQLLEAKAVGASAALLIARAVAPDELRELVQAARDLPLEILLEVRDERELDLALELEPAVIGINNRNLETLAIDPSTSERLLARIPSGVVAIAESGVSTRADVERVARAGADAVLVGSSLSAADDAAGAVRALTGVGRIARRG